MKVAIFMRANRASLTVILKRAPLDNVFRPKLIPPKINFKKLASFLFRIKDATGQYPK